MSKFRLKDQNWGPCSHLCLLLNRQSWGGGGRGGAVRVTDAKESKCLVCCLFLYKHHLIGHI